MGEFIHDLFDTIIHNHYKKMTAKGGKGREKDRNKRRRRRTFTMHIKGKGFK